ITAMAGFEVALAFPFVGRFSGLGLGLDLRGSANLGMAGFTASEPVITSRCLHAPRAIATGRTSVVSTCRNLSSAVMKAKCPALGIRIKSFLGALTHLKYSTAACVGVI